MKFKDILRGVAFALAILVAACTVLTSLVVVDYFLGAAVGIPVVFFGTIFAVLTYLAAAFYAGRRNYLKAQEAAKSKQIDVELDRMLNRY